MSKKQGLVLIIVVQLVILVAMFVKAFYPLYIGQEILLKVEARDPRDIFRGNFVDLNYNFNQIDLDSVKNDLDSIALSKVHFGDKFYLELKQEGKYYKPVAVWKEKPNSQGIFMRILANGEFYGRILYVKGGIESYFTSTENALKIEKLSSFANRDSVTVEVAVKVAFDGAARIAQVNITEK
jgi:uncharacterized membrane-anchored protein